MFWKNFQKIFLNFRWNQRKNIGEASKRIFSGTPMRISAHSLKIFLMEIMENYLDEFQIQYMDEALVESLEKFLEGFSLECLEKILAKFSKQSLLDSMNEFSEESLKEFLFWIPGGTPHRVTWGYTDGFPNYLWNLYKKFLVKLLK